MSLPPPLVIESIETGDERASAELQIGPHREQIVVGFGYAGLISYEKIPRRLGDRATLAISRILHRAYNGEQLSLPMDLSTLLFNGEPDQWPLFLNLENHEPDPFVAIEITRVEDDTPRQGVATVHLNVAGLPTVVTVDRGPGTTVLFSFVSGAHPWQLSDAGGWDMLMALMKATRPDPPSTLQGA